MDASGENKMTGKSKNSASVFPPDYFAEARTEHVRLDTSKSRNPKDLASEAKLPLSVLPPVGLIHTAQVMRLGSEEYGVANWRSEPIKASVYHNAIQRHLMKYLSGDYLDEKSGVPHLAHIAANCLILMDAEHIGVLTDDTFYAGSGVTELIAEYSKERT